MRCFFCGNEGHEFKCPSIKAYEYRKDGSVARIEFVTAADFPAKTFIEQTAKSTLQ